MWLFTRYGFYSIVSARQGGRRHGPIDPDQLMVRARRREHLEALQARFPEALGSVPIADSTDTDYAHRIVVPKATWVRVAAALAEEIEYGNFKSEVASHLGAGGAAYEHALHEVWSVMYGLQRRGG